jgi:hypothetical protein
MADIYSNGLLAIADGTISWNVNTLKAIIVDSGYTFNKAHQYVTSVSADEVTNSVGTGYERKTLTGKTVTLATNVVKFDCADIIYTAVTTTQVWDKLIVFSDTGSDATSPLIACLTIDAVTTSGANVTITITDIMRFDNA